MRSCETMKTLNCERGITMSKNVFENLDAAVPLGTEIVVTTAMNADATPEVSFTWHPSAKTPEQKAFWHEMRELAAKDAENEGRMLAAKMLRTESNPDNVYLWMTIKTDKEADSLRSGAYWGCGVCVMNKIGRMDADIAPPEDFPAHDLYQRLSAVAFAQREEDLPFFLPEIALDRWRGGESPYDIDRLNGIYASSYVISAVEDAVRKDTADGVEATMEFIPNQAYVQKDEQNPDRQVLVLDFDIDASVNVFGALAQAAFHGDEQIMEQYGVESYGELAEMGNISDACVRFTMDKKTGETEAHLRVTLLSQGNPEVRDVLLNDTEAAYFQLAVEDSLERALVESGQLTEDQYDEAPITLAEALYKAMSEQKESFMAKKPQRDDIEK